MSSPIGAKTSPRPRASLWPVTLALLAALFAAGCANDPAPIDERDAQVTDESVSDGAADLTEEEPPVAVCEPACEPDTETCRDDVCVCAEDFHEGGGDDARCVPVGSCSDGYAIAPGQRDCEPIREVCPGPLQCESLAGWWDGTCQYEDVDDGTPCESTSSDPCITEFECLSGLCMPIAPTCSDAHRPLVLVHGVNGSSENFDTMVGRLIEDGWPEDTIYLFDAEDPSWGCNVDNAAVIAELVETAMAETCEPRLDIIAHSMGTISSRYYMKNLGGHEVVNTYVTLGGMHHGLLTPCLAPEFLDVCVWQELCQSGEFIEQLNADPATPGETHWVSIYGTADSTVPNRSSHLDGAENIEMDGVEHDGENGLLEREDVYGEVLRVLQYPCW